MHSKTACLSNNSPLGMMQRSLCRLQLSPGVARSQLAQLPHASIRVHSSDLDALPHAICSLTEWALHGVADLAAGQDRHCRSLHAQGAAKGVHKVEAFAGAAARVCCSCC